MKLSTVAIYVDDQDKALHFYTDILGLEKKNDFTHDGYRWLTVVSPEEGSLELQLANADQHPAGKAFQQALAASGERAIMFYVDSVEAEFERLTAAGAEFTQPPTQVTGSTIAVLKDGVGNLVQLTKLSWG